MRKRKSQNSFIFFSTLGLYLGLVLVGATPVFGHAALARQFDLRDEADYSDEFDNDPDDERSPASVSLEVYLGDVEYFLASLARLGSRGNFDAGRDTFEAAQSTQLPCVAANKVGSYTADRFAVSNPTVRPPLEWFSKRLTDGYSLADCLPSERFGGAEAAASDFFVKFDSTVFDVSVRAKKHCRVEAERSLAELRQATGDQAAKEQNSIRRQILAATSFSTAQDKVLVVTRLPRAGLVLVSAR